MNFRGGKSCQRSKQFDGLVAGQAHIEPRRLIDRLLVAQALVEPRRLITHDAALARYSDTIILI